MIPESSIEPVDMPALADVEVTERGRHRRRSAGTVVVKLNGGLGTSMGMDRAKSLLEVRDGLTLPRHHRPAGARARAELRRHRCRWSS